MSDWNLDAFRERLHRFETESDPTGFSRWSEKPNAFARRALGAKWWSAQREAAELLARNRRVAVRSANGVGKSYLAAGLVLWFLMCHTPSMVLTTAPTERQVRHILWREIRRRHASAKRKLPGRLFDTRLEIADDWFAMGFASDSPVAMQGFHARNLLVVFDEASGVPDAMWEAAEGVAVGENNRILAIGNPLETSGRFYEVFRDASRWKTLSISAFDHPNLTGREAAVPGCVSAASAKELIREWCEEVPEPAAETIEWEGRHYLPSNAFRARVLGQFPSGSDDSLFELRWIEDAMRRELDPVGVRRVAADIARYGKDETAIGARIGPVLVRLDCCRKLDMVSVAGRIARMAREIRAETVAIDAAGLGAGAGDILRAEGVNWLDEVIGGAAATDGERFANRRAELYWGLRELLRRGEIALPEDSVLREQLMSVRYRLNAMGRILIESKEDLRRRGLSSPDRADMLAMLFDSGAEVAHGFLSGNRWNEYRPSMDFRQEMPGWLPRSES